MANIAKILENAPIGTKLYSPICGECTLEEIDSSRNVVVCDKSESLLPFYSDGTYNDNGECLLWPSKEWQKWINWQNIIMRDEICLGAIVMSGTNTSYIITRNGFAICENPSKCLDFTYGMSIDMHFADIEESEKAMELLERNGYKWCEETETLEKINTPVFEIGEWIVHNFNHQDIRKILSIENDKIYVCQTVDCAISGGLSIEIVDKYYHIWSLRDVQLGDILTDSDGYIFLTDGKTYANSVYGNIDGADFICSIDNQGEFITKYDAYCLQDDRPWSSKNLRPSTYEERQKLFSALSSNGYKLCINNGIISGIEKITEEPLEAVPTMLLESDMPEVEPNKKPENRPEEKFKEDLKELLIKHNMDQLMSIPADIIVEYMTENLKNMHTLITKERKVFYKQNKAIN